MEGVANVLPKTGKRCLKCGQTYPIDAAFCSTDGTALSEAPGESDTYLGRKVLDQIEIVELIGSGAMGRVYRAIQHGMDRDVAVKILRRELSANPQLVARFQREAKVASRLQHPNVVHAHLSAQLPDGALCIVMEFLDGISLQQALVEQSRMAVARALHIVLQAADAIGEAHASGIVHRDIKPENIMLIRRGANPDFVKVLDFGVARLSWGEQSMATQAGLIFGTARYVSPEGAQGQAVGPQGDVYSLATLTYQLLSGRTPFDADQAVGLLICQIHDTPPEILSLPDTLHIPAAVAAVVMQNLAKLPSDREPDARAFGQALAQAAFASGIDATKLAGGAFGEAHASLGASRALARTSVADPPSPAPRALVSRALDATLDDGALVNASVSGLGVATDTPAPRPRTSRRKVALAKRAAAIIAACFVLGGASALLLSSKFGFVSTSHRSELEREVTRAKDALLHHRYDAPPGQCVRDITREGLAKWPNDPGLLRVRYLAADDTVQEARNRRFEGDLGEARRLVQLARELHPEERDALDLEAEIERDRALILSGETKMHRGTVRVGIRFRSAHGVVDRGTFRVLALKAKELKNVELTVSGGGLQKPSTLPMRLEGGYWTTDYAFPKEGVYDITVNGVDGTGAELQASRQLTISR
jgi:serine/threonine-protein kinase